MPKSISYSNSPYYTAWWFCREGPGQIEFLLRHKSLALCSWNVFIAGKIFSGYSYKNQNGWCKAYQYPYGIIHIPLCPWGCSFLWSYTIQKHGWSIAIFVHHKTWNIILCEQTLPVYAQANGSPLAICQMSIALHKTDHSIWSQILENITFPSWSILWCWLGRQSRWPSLNWRLLNFSGSKSYLLELSEATNNCSLQYQS